MGEQLCLVTGATGAFGPTLIGELLARGHRVRGLARRAPAPDTVPDGVSILSGDICDRALVSEAVEGADVVFHLAASLHVPNPSPALRVEYERVNVQGTQVVVEAAQAAGVHRLVHFSTISVYGPTGPAPVDEAAPVRPDSIYGETKLAAEAIALSAAAAGSGRPLGVVLRMAAIYGPRMKGNYPRLVRALARKRFLPVGNGRNLRTLVYDEDGVAAAILAAQEPLAAGRVYNVSDGGVHRVEEIIGAICRALGRRPPRVFMPAESARLAAALADRTRALIGRPARFEPAVDKLLETVAVRADRIQQELGFRPQFELERGWRETVAAWTGATTPG